ncbi:MAG TPA: DUF3857 domain-containing protein [Bacteroidales bacterium]|nr:DUF3857 domain-containing protein [Bacteroidales bacterium]
MKHVVFTLLLSCSFFSVFGQLTYSVDIIPDSLKANANAVVREFDISYERLNLSDYVKKVHIVTTILNEKGKNNAALVIYYDNNSDITEVNGNVFDRNGFITKKVKRKEMRDYAAFENYIMFSDNRALTFLPAINMYPFTIEYNYTVKYKGAVGIETWEPQYSYSLSVQAASIRYKTPSNLELKYLPLNYNFDFTKNESNAEIEYGWKVKNLKAVKKEPFMPTSIEVLPTLLLTPSRFSYERTEGDFSSWENFGKWIYTLNKGREELPVETMNKIKALTNPIADKKEKVKAVYRYMQDKTRYVCVSVGIGGLQTAKASEVDKLGYGDCKALSNYTKALLNCIGIKSYYTVIGNGNCQIRFTDFPSGGQTNHIILCVPLETDTIWLECTSQKMPFGFIGSDNSNRFALLITEEGGKLVRTPTYADSTNLSTANTKLKVNADKSADFQIKRTYSNLAYEWIFPLLYQSSKEQKDYLLEYFADANTTINTFSFKDLSGVSANGVMEASGRLNSFTSTSGNRVFINPAIVFRRNNFSEIKKSRKQPLFIEYGYAYNDTLNIAIPDNCIIESKPADLSFKSSLGEYSIRYENVGQKINIIRRFYCISGTYSTNQLGEIVSFIEKIDNADNDKIVLKNK